PTQSCVSDAPACAALYTLSLHDALPIWSPRVRTSGWTNHGPLSAAHQWAGSTSPGWPVSTPVPRATPPSSMERTHAEGMMTRSRSEEHTSELQSRFDLVCRLLLETKNIH